MSRQARIRLISCLGLTAVLGLTSCGGDSNRTPAREETPALIEAAPLDIGGPAPGTPWNLTLLYSNDLHAQLLPAGDTGRGGLARQATLVRLVQEQAAAGGAGVLVVDAGDVFEGTLFHDLDGGALTLQLLDEIGTDVLQIGNHDHQFGAQRLFDVLSTAFTARSRAMVITWGNVDPRTMDTTGASDLAPVTREVIDAFENGFADIDPASLDAGLLDPPFALGHVFQQCVWFERGGVRIGVFGLDTSDVLYTPVVGMGELLVDRTGISEGLTFHDPIASAYTSRMLDILDDPDGDPATDDGADLIVCVSHIGLTGDLQVAENAVSATGRRIDVIIGGHSHHRIGTAIPVEHPTGDLTLVTQAFERGSFLGRLDLQVDVGADRATLLDCRLLEVDSRVQEDPAIAARISTAMSEPGGLEDRFDDPLNDLVATGAQALSLPGAAPSILGTLGVDAGLAAGRIAAGADVAMIGAFDFRAGLPQGEITAMDIAEVFPLHDLDATGLSRDSLAWVELDGGLVDAPNPARRFDPAALPETLDDITRVELLLELIYSLPSLLGSLVSPGSDLGDLGGFLDGLQWAGVSCVVDHSAPLFERIDPGTITIGGRPLAEVQDDPVRMVSSSVLAQIAFPIVQQILVVESPPGSGLLEPIFQFDPQAGDTGIPLADALTAHVRQLGILDADSTPLGVDRVQSLACDLLVDQRNAVFQPATAPPGADVALSVPVLNAGRTAASRASLQLWLDPTPSILADDPDGLTDDSTGATERLLATVQLTGVPPFAAGVAGRADAVIAFTVPADLLPGAYPLEPRLVGVQSDDPVGIEIITGNNARQEALPVLIVE